MKLIYLFLYLDEDKINLIQLRKLKRKNIIKIVELKIIILLL